MRRRRQVRLVGDAAARVVADGAGLEPGAQVLREVARGAVVAGHDDGRAPHVAVRQRGDHVRAQRLRDERRAALVRQLGGGRIVLEMVEERAESHWVRAGERSFVALGLHDLGLRRPPGEDVRAARSARPARPARPSPRPRTASQLGLEPLQVRAERHGAEVLVRVLRIHEHVVRPGPDVDPAEPLEPLRRLLRGGEVPRPRPAGEARARTAPAPPPARRPPSAPRRCRRRRTGRPAGRRARARRAAARTAVRGRRSSGRSRWRGSRRPGGRARARAGRPRARRRASPSRSRAASTIAGEPSTATTSPRGSRSTSAAVTRPVPQPASSTRSSPRRSSRSSTSRPIASSGPDMRS